MSLDTMPYGRVQNICRRIGVSVAVGPIEAAPANHHWNAMRERHRQEAAAGLLEDLQAANSNRDGAEAHYQALMRAMAGRTFDQFAALMRGARAA